MTLNTHILVGAVSGVAAGFALAALGPETVWASPAIMALGVIGNIFVDMLKMILIPLVFTSITVGIANLRAHAQMDRVWKLSLLYFVSTTALAVLMGLAVVNIFKPGVGMEIGMLQDIAAKDVSLQSLSVGAFVQKCLSNVFVNPMQAMAEGQVLPTIIFALLMGIGLIIAGERARMTLQLINEFFELIMMIVGWIMRLLPLGIFALLTKLVATQDPALFVSLGKYVAIVMCATLFHGFVSLPLMLGGFGKMHPSQFYLGVKDALVTAFSTSSSSATLPVTYRCVKDNLRVDKDVAGFVLPLGATINMDGTAMYEAIAAVFVANLAGVELNIAQQLIVFMMAMLASIGAPGIPSAGLVTIVMVLQSVGLPVEAIAILIPIDRLLDATRTMVNVEGDMIGSVIVDRYTTLRPS